MDDGDEPETTGGPLLPPAPALFVGPPDAPDRYELLGDGIPGGEGVTWKARYHGDLASPLPLAVKLLRPPGHAGPHWPSPRDRQRWRDHAVLLRHLQLDHVVRLDEVFSGAAPHPPGDASATTGTSAYLVMEWVEGPTLQVLLGGRPAEAGTIGGRLGYIGQAAEALSALASVTRSGGNPSLHRDVKPSNCIVHPERGLVLIDVSTLRLVDDGHDPVGWHTPGYTAPEVLAAPHLPRAVAADVYSLGALAFFCLTGHNPPVTDPREPIVRAAASAGVDAPDALAAHISAALDPDPARRPQDLLAWSRNLIEAATVRRAPSRWRRPVVAVGSATITAVAVLLLLPDLIVEKTNTPVPAPPANVGGEILSPADGADVEQCSYFSGTAALPPGTTLILAMRNLDNGDPERYLQVVFGYDKTETLANWRGAQYFGTEKGGVGQNYQVDLLAVRVDGARAYHESASGDVDRALADSGTLLDSVRVHRVAGTGPGGCEGPPGN
ncbi:serine/threonine protein kinase [Herbidospora daliensis]|uniref:serine/threonine protein kinase n=1 Tax=Herbidospora daliensis TaxID=295585 RepID=UPI000782C504|nr:protein kinase [Herbidospora daliensis]